MSYFSVFEGMPGLRRVVIGDAGGSVLDAMGGITSEAENTAGLAAVVSRQLGSIGQTLRLGTCEFIAVRSQISALVFLPRGGTLATVEIDPKRLSSEVESKLRSADWTARGSNRPTGGPPPIPPAIRQAQPVPVKSGAAPVRPPIGGTIGSETRALRPLRGESIPVALPPPEAVKPPDGTRPGLPAVPHLPPPFPPALTPFASDYRSKAKATGSLPASGNDAMFSGDIHMVCVPDLLEFCRNGQRTGVLLCSSGEGSGRVRLRRGMIVDAASPKASTLLKRLVDSGDTFEEQVRDMALSSEDEVDNVLMALTLIDGGFTDPEVVRKAMRAQIQTAIEQMLHWTEGKFAFHPTTLESEPFEPAVEIDPHIVLLQIFKEQDEAAR